MSDPTPAPTSCRADSASGWPSPGPWWAARSIVFADEPTGNLDQATGRAILGLFEDLHDLGVTIVVITHDRDIAARMGRRIEMLDGQIVFDSADTVCGAASPARGGAAEDEATRP